MTLRIPMAIDDFIATIIEIWGKIVERNAKEGDLVILHANCLPFMRVEYVKWKIA